MRNITAVTVARSDYGILLPILRTLDQDPELRLRLIVSGMHLAPEFGLTYQAIEADGFTINDRVEMLLSSDTPEGIAKSKKSTVPFPRKIRIDAPAAVSGDWQELVLVLQKKGIKSESRRSALRQK